MEVSYSITLLPIVIAEDIPKLDVFWRGEVRDAIRSKLTTNPEIYGKPLRQSLQGCRRLRVGDYRAVFKIEKRVVQVIAIIHRSTKYKGVEKRLL
jgi:mRNA interferase RelE/StbE